MHTSANPRRKSKKVLVLGGLALVAVVLVTLALFQSKRASSGPGGFGGRGRSGQFSGPQPVQAAARRRAARPGRDRTPRAGLNGAPPSVV